MALLNNEERQSSSSPSATSTTTPQTSSERIIPIPKADAEIHTRPPSHFHPSDDMEDERDSESDEEDGQQVLQVPEARVQSEGSRTSEGFGRGWHAMPRIRANGLMAWGLFREAAPAAVGGVGILVLVGRLLSRVTQWEVSVRVDTLLVLVPVLLNALGNAIMTLSLRLATATHGNLLHNRRERLKLLKANLAFLLFQATVVATLAGAVAFGLRQLLPVEDTEHPPLPWLERLLLVLAASSGAGIVASGVVGQALCATVLLGPRLGLDPDNLAAPVASGPSDLITLLLVSLSGAGLWAMAEWTGPWVSVLVLLLALGAGGTCGVFAYRQPETRTLLSQGWVPLLAAAGLASGAGLVLDTQAHDLPGYANLAPVLAGLAGNCAAILLSRESTRLHYAKSSLVAHTNPALSTADDAPQTDTVTAHDTEAEVELDTYPHHHGGYHALGRSIHTAFSYLHPVEGWVSAVVLLLIGWGVGGGYLAYLRWSPTSQVEFGRVFGACLMVVLVIAVGISLLLAHALALFFWRKGYDPDMYALPLVLALVDVMSQLLLSAAFATAGSLGDAPRSLETTK